MPASKHRHKAFKNSRSRRKLHNRVAVANQELMQQAVKQAAEAGLPDKERGLYGKYQIRRVDGSTDKGKKHEKCDYFVLDVTHDPHAAPALFSYAASAKADGYEQLAADLYAKIQPYIKALDKRVAEDLLEEIEAMQPFEKMDDAQLRDAVSTLVWADLPMGERAALALEHLLDRYEKLTTPKPKKARVPRKKKDAEAANTETEKQTA